MNRTMSRQLSNLLHDNSPGTVLREVKAIYSPFHGKSSFQKVIRACAIVEKLFRGKMNGYRECNTEYHDLGHTIDVFLATARLLDGHAIENGPLDDDLASLILVAALLHDAGYIQETADKEGTGAKYTLNHVDRSIEFAFHHRDDFTLSLEEAEVVGRIIKATEFSMDFSMIPYRDNKERLTGAILGTADLMGQMADRIYLEKLLFLYNEFREAGIPGYTTEFDILKKTVGFYSITRKKLVESFEDVGRYASSHFRERHGIDENLYQTAIDRNMEYLDHILNDASTNFRHKLKRANFQQHEKVAR